MSGEEITRRLQERGKLLLRLLHGAKREHERRIVAWGGLRILARVLAGAAVLVLLAALVPALPRAVGIGITVLAWLGAGVLIYEHWARPLRAIPSLAVFSRLVEERRDFRDLLRAGLEFSQRGAPAGESHELVAATVDRAYDEARALRLPQLFAFEKRRRDAALATAALAALALVALLSPSAPARALRGLAFDWPRPGDTLYGDLEVVTGDLTVLAGEDAEVVVRETGVRSPEVALRFNDTGDLWKSRVLEPQSLGSPREYAFRFEDLRDGLTYRFESARRRTPEHRIAVVQRPIVSRLQLRLVPPAYTGKPAQVLEEGRGDAVALRGTRIEIEGECSSPLVRAILVPEGDAAGLVSLAGPQDMTIERRRFRAGFVLKSDVRYHIELTDSLGHANTDPVAYQIGAVDDRPPYVEVREPGGDSEIPKSMSVPLAIYAADDYGIARLTLGFRREKTDEPLDLPWTQRNLDLRGAGSADPEGRALGAGPIPEILKRLDWDVGSLGLFPGDLVEYWVEVEDNDGFSGHKTARSPVYRLRLQSLSEIYAEIQKQDDNRKSELDDALEKGKQLRDKYEKLARELKKNPEMDWKKQKEVESALEKQKQLADQVDKIGKDLEKQIDKLQSQQTMSAEIVQKMEEIRKLLEDVENQQLREYMQRLQEAMKQISPEEIQRAMEQMQLSQEDFLKRLERTKSLLEQLKREQRLDALIERIADLLKNQEELGRKTEQASGEKQPKDGAPKESPETLAREQKDLAEKTSEAQKDLDALTKESQQAGQQQLDQANQEMQQQDPSQEMSEASEQLQQQSPQQAQPHQQSAEKSLRSLYQQLMQAQSSMSMKSQAEAAAKLAQAARQALDVSFRQEGLSRKAAPAGDLDRQGEMAQQQQALLSATGKVVEDLDALAQKSMQAPPQVGELLGEAMARMRTGVGAFEKGNGSMGREQGEEAYGYLNRAVVELNRSASSSCSKPGGGQGSSQALEQLMGKQQQLNDASRQLQQAMPNPQSMTPEQRAQMSRLLGEQQSIQSELQDIERQAREQQELLGRLDKMQDEMREVVEDMSSETLDEETLRVQERIVSRMLDAQRSLHKRDFNEERESRTAAEIFSKGGKALPEGEKLKQLRRDVERALREGTPEEYEELVRQYFRAISEAETKASPTP